jgi:predicted metallopeptidase
MMILGFRGRKANQYGYDQYGAHSQQIVAHREYSGVTFSVADKDINDYALVYAQYLQNPLRVINLVAPKFGDELVKITILQKLFINFQFVRALRRMRTSSLS